MTADECHDRASACAANAALTADEPVRQAFLRLAARWRALATQEIFLGPIDVGLEPPVAAVGSMLPPR